MLAAEKSIETPDRYRFSNTAPVIVLKPLPAFVNAWQNKDYSCHMLLRGFLSVSGMADTWGTSNQSVNKAIKQLQTKGIQLDTEEYRLAR